MDWRYLMLHHSLTRDSGTVSWQAIRRYHKSLGWRAEGYHYFCERINDEYEIIVGRDLNQRGAHCKEASMNKLAIGVCLVGNFDEAPPPQAQWDRAVKFVAGLCEQLSIPPDNIVAHRDYATKSCPGVRFNMDAFRTDVVLVSPELRGWR